MRTTLPQPGDERIKSWFAFLPVTLNRERRWLERVAVRQRLECFGAREYFWREPTEPAERPFRPVKDGYLYGPPTTSPPGPPPPPPKPKCPQCGKTP